MLRSKLWPVSGACALGLFEYLSTLRLICAQYGRVSGIEQETDPTSSASSSKKGLKDNNKRVLLMLTSFVSLLVQKLRYKSGGLDSDCTEVTLHRVAKFAVKHLNSDIEQTRRGIILLVILLMQPLLVLLYCFSVTNTVSRPVFRFKIVIF